MCFVFIWEQTATCATYSINWLVFITESSSVYSAVRTGPTSKAVCAASATGIVKWSCVSIIWQFPVRKKIHTSRNPEQYSSSGSQSNWSTTPVILGWTLINGSPGRNVSIGWERKRHRDWKHWYLLLRPYQISERFDSKLADVGNPLFEQPGTHLRWPSVDLRPLIRGNQYRILVLVTRKVVVDTLNRANWNFFGYPDWGISVLFLSCKTNAWV